MSMSAHAVGFAPPDEAWQKMKAVWDSCQAAKVPVPKEVEMFFGWDNPDPAGVEVSLPVRKWDADMREGYELDVADIPAHVKTIRFWNSW
jgi:hypothetical protein